MQSSEYRRFNVTPAQAGDDYAAMREALTRRYARIVAGEYPAPDLLVIDGGKGQVGVAASVLEEQGLHGVPLIGIAKGPERKAGLEDIVFPGPRRRAQPAVRTIPACTCCSRSATRRIASRSRAIARGARKARTDVARCRRSPASAPSAARRCSRTSAA